MERMNIRTSIITVCLAILGLLVSCEKYDKDIEGDINFYLLDDYNTELNSFRIVNDGITLSDKPIISYEEIIEYNAEEYSFKFASVAAERLGSKYMSAFAVVLEGKIIYTGYLWSSLSSAIVDWVVIDIALHEYSSVMTVQLGYPWLDESWSIPDKRNDNRLLSVFARDGKLRD